MLASEDCDDRSPSDVEMDSTTSDFGAQVTHSENDVGKSSKRAKENVPAPKLEVNLDQAGLVAFTEQYGADLNIEKARHEVVKDIFHLEFIPPWKLTTLQIGSLENF